MDASDDLRIKEESKRKNLSKSLHGLRRSMDAHILAHIYPFGHKY